MWVINTLIRFLSCIAGVWRQGPVSQKFVRTIFAYEFVEPVLNYRPNKFVALMNLCEAGPCSFPKVYGPS